MKTYTKSRGEALQEELFAIVKDGLQKGEPVELNTWEIMGTSHCGYPTVRAAVAGLAANLRGDARIQILTKRGGILIQPAELAALAPAEQLPVKPRQTYPCHQCGRICKTEDALRLHMKVCPKREGA